MIGFDGKGISVGVIVIKDNIIENNRIGIASKDNSSVFSQNIFGNNEIDFASYMKKPHFGGSQINISRNRKGLEKFRLVSDVNSNFYVYDTYLGDSLGEGHEAFDKTFQLLVNLNKLK